MRINITKNMFSDSEINLLEYNTMNVVAFRYGTGVEALKVTNENGYFIILPFQGQQIWRAHFCGKDLHMKTTFDEPVPTKEYLETYGGFLLHCGINAFGVPGEKDTHPQHGEIPNACYNQAFIDCSSDENGDYISVGGNLTYNKSFVKSYRFSPVCKLYSDGTVLNISAEIENLRSYPMEYMYLCHINFRPTDGAELVYSAPYDSKHIKVYDNNGDGIEEPRRTQLLDYIDLLKENPSLMNTVGAPEQIYDPEICFRIKYCCDESGRAYTMQYMNDGAFYVSHPTDVLPDAIRWISRTSHEDSMGMVLPCTAEHLGYTHAKENGQIKMLPPNGKISFTIEAGYIDAKQAEKVKKKIENITNTAKTI